MPSVRARTVLTPDGPLADAEVAVEGDRIVTVRPSRPGTGGPAAAPTHDVLAPGFVDLQVNGIDDVDVARARGADWDRLDERLLAQGTTTWCPTLVTAPLDAYARPLAAVARAQDRTGARPRIAGVHLEGPFLGRRPGAHRQEHLVPLDRAWLDARSPAPAVLTLAPELDGAAEATAALVARGTLVALGHSDASASEARACVDAGARLATHLFNGMAPLDHRSPGLVGLALADPRLVPSLIADLVHVDPLVLTATARAAGAGGWVLVTDAVAWRAGTAGPVELELRDGAPRLADGTLAGSALAMDAAVRNVVAACGIPLADAVRAASTTPADLLGLPDRGRIAPGCLADLVALDDALEVSRTWVGGEVAP